LENLKILIVDDIPANIISLEYLINEYFNDIDILTALNGEEALKYTLMSNIDLIILDIQMPILDGFETAKYLKKVTKTKDIPIIFLTATLKDEEYTQKGFEVGAIDYLVKPINNDQFVNKLKLYIQLFKKNKELLFNQDLLLKTLDTFTAFSHNHKTIQTFNLLANINLFIVSIQEELNKKNIIIDIDIPENLTIKSYPIELNQCINYLFNCAKDRVLNSNKHNYISIVARKANDKILLEFKDNGDSTDAEKYNKVLKSTILNKNRLNQSDLELYMINIIINFLNGTISANSCDIQVDNRNYSGTNFTIIIKG